MRGVGLQAKVEEETLQADPGPAGRSYKITAHRVRDAGESDELVQGFIAPEIIQREGQRLFDNSRDLEPPYHAVQLRRGRVNVYSVVPLQGGVFGPRAGRRLDSSTSVWQDVSCGPRHQALQFHTTVAFRQETHHCSAHRDGRRVPCKPDQEFTSVDTLCKGFGIHTWFS